jgi:hypothetical protein
MRATLGRQFAERNPQAIDSKNQRINRLSALTPMPKTTHYLILFYIEKTPPQSCSTIRKTDIAVLGAAPMGITAAHILPNRLPKCDPAH